MVKQKELIGIEITITQDDIDIDLTFKHSDNSQECKHIIFSGRKIEFWKKSGSWVSFDNNGKTKL